MDPITIRRATPDDAEGIARVIEVIAAERVHSAIEQAWDAASERRFIESLSPREAIHVAADAVGSIVGLQSLDRWSAYLSACAHVGQLGTFVLPEWRGRGLGHRLWDASARLARECGYRKLVIQVR